jgi:hypothetical protein
MGFNNNASRMYVVQESTAGTLKSPSSGTEAIALQPGFEMKPDVNIEQNEELRASIGPTKPITGLEKPSASFSHYLRHSGVEGVPPDSHLLLKSIFGSSQDFYSDMTVSALNDKLNFTDDNGTVTATVAHATYKTPQALATAITTAMNAANGAQTATCTYSTVTGKFKIVSTGTVLSLLWKTGANGSDFTDTHIGTLIGFSDAADSSGTAATTGYTAATATNGIERVLTAASTVSLLKLTAGGGADYATKGRMVLIKDGTNGYSLRFVDSRSTDDLTLNFDLASAPASGISLGMPIAYIPVNEGHPTLSLWLYRANVADIEAEAGVLITQMAMSIEVGKLLNMNFTAGGTQFFFNPIEITATTKYIDVVDDSGTYAIALTAKIYRTPQELASAAQAALNAASTMDWTVTYNSIGANAGKFTFSATGATVTIKWNTGANTANSAAAKFGFSTAADSSAATSYNSTSAQSYVDSLTPDLDSSDPLIVKDNEVLIGDASSYVSMCVQSMNLNVGLDTTDVKCIKSVTGVESKAVKKRNSSIEVTAVLEKYDADKFDRFINNTTTKFQFSFGPKSGGNWVAGRCGGVYSPQATVSGFRVGESDGVVTMIFTIAPYVDGSGNPEIYLGLV